MLFKILDIPFVYRLAQTVLAPGARTLIPRHTYSEYLEKSRVILDIGCGPRLTRPAEAQTIIGVDVVKRYLAHFQSAQGIRADLLKIMPHRPRCIAVGAGAEYLPFSSGVFDQCRCTAVLHHLSDQAAERCLKEMARVLAPGGRIIVFDAVLPESFCDNPLAFCIGKADRGRFIRTHKVLLKLLEGAQIGPWRTRKFCYSYTGLTGLIAVCRPVA